MTEFKEGFMGVEKEEVRNLYLVYGDTDELVAANVNLDKAFHEMNRYLDKVNFKSYYVRTWDASKDFDRRMVMDFGSHYKFFHWANGPRVKSSKEPKLTYEQMEKNFIERDEANERE